MIVFTEHDQIDFAKWDQCIAASLNGNHSAWSWYLDIVNPEWCALVEDDYLNVFPLPTSRRLGITYSLQPVFTQQLGLFTMDGASAEKAGEFLQKIPKRYRYIDLNLNIHNTLPAATHAEMQTNLELDLIQEYSSLARGYQPNLARNLKKAAQHHLSVSVSVKPEDIISLFRANRGTAIAQLKEKQYAVIQRIAYECLYRGTGQCWGVYDAHNQLVAGAIWVFSHQKAVFLFSGLSDDGRKLNAMPFLIDSFIKKHAGLPLIIDFEGSGDEGLARFYSGFGSKAVLYPRIKRSNLPPLMQTGLQWWRKMRQFLKI